MWGEDSGISHTEGISIIKGVLATVEDFIQDPGRTLSTTQDFFGSELPKSKGLDIIMKDPIDKGLFLAMRETCLMGVCNVLKRQYSKYFQIDINEQLQRETETAHLHNIDAGQVMGMFRATKDKAPNATLCFIPCRICAKVLSYLDG